MNEMEKKILRNMTAYGKILYNNLPELQERIKICLEAKLDYDSFKEIDILIKQLSNFGINEMFDKMTDDKYIEKFNNFGNYMIKSLDKIIENNNLNDKQIISIENVFSTNIKDFNVSDESTYFIFLTKLSILKEFLEKENLPFTKEHIFQLKYEMIELSEKIPDINENKEEYIKLFSTIENNLKEKEESNQRKINKL
ncbi:hypothetical protein B0619_07175 [Campylobacter lari]|nr:hypothetical protein [Campylobacter lari]EAK5786987.1 hypothetical protein [Campylobacter lari]